MASPLPPHADGENVFITHLEKEGSYINIFVQIHKKNAYVIEKILHNLSSFLDSNDTRPITLGDAQIGLLCCTKYEDGKYYRARVLNVENVRQTYMATVNFIDHGNSALVKVTDLRLLSKLKELFQTSDHRKQVEYLEEIPDLAKPCVLFGLPVKDWEHSVIEVFREEYCNQDLRCHISEFHNKHVIRMLQPEFNPLAVLAKRGYKIPPSLNEQKPGRLPPERFNTSVPPPSVLRQPPPTNHPNLSQPPPLPRVGLPRSEGYLPPIPSNNPNVIRPNSVLPGRSVVPGVPQKKNEAGLYQTSLPSQALQFSTEMLAPGTSHPVFVSHVEDGPYIFAVQIQQVVNSTLMKMMAELSTITPKPISAPLNPGSICLARYSNDGSLCRAIVTNVCDDKVKLYFADFGNTEMLSYSDVFQIPPEFVSPKVMSHRFSLANIKTKVYTEQEKKIFKDLVNNSSHLHMTVTPPEDNPLKQYCELFLNCKNIKVMIDELSLTQPLLRYIPVPIPLKGSQEKVFVPFVLNPGRFFVQLDKNNFSLKSVMKVVASHCRTASHIPLSHLRVGEPCCAMFEEETWYRGEILKIMPDNKAFVNFVDFGNQDEIELVNLRQTTPELVTSVKAQALVCCLIGYENKYDVDEETSNRFEELILEKTMMMHVLGCTPNNVLIVQLLDKEGQDISTLLMARPIQAPAIHNNYPVAAAPVTVPSPVATENAWEDNAQAAPAENTWEDNSFSDSRAQSGEDNKKNWRSQDNDRGRFNRDDTRGGRFGREEESGGRYGNRDDNKRFGDRGGKFNDEEKPRFGGRSNDDDKPRYGGRSNDDEKPRFGGRFNDEEKPRFGGRSNDDEKPRYGAGRFNESDEKPRFGSNRFGDSNRNDGDRPPFRKRDDDSGGDRWNKDKGSGGSWKDNDNSGGGWKPRESNNERWNDGRGDSGDRFGSGDGGYKRGGFNRDNQGERSNFRSKPWERGGSDGFRGSAPKPKPNTVGGMPQSEVKVGSTEETQVVFTTSPLEFYVQLTRSFEELTLLMDKIATGCDSGTINDLTNVQEKIGCLAKYSDDDTWYRAVVEEKSFDSAKVLFVDYGNQESVTFDKIKELPEDMTTLPVQAVKCRLFGVPETVEVEPFSALVDGKNLKTHFVAKNFLAKSFEVVLVDEENGSNINVVMGASEEQTQTILSQLGTTSLLYPQLPVGSTVTTQLTWYQSPSQFYLQQMATHPEFRAMMQSMQAVKRSGIVKQNNELSIGDFVIAKFKADNVLYRALVSEAGFVPKVQYVDYGNTELVESGAVWQMEAEFATLPIQALNCCLAGVLPAGDSWPKEGTTALDSHFEADTLECSVVGELESQCLVSLTKGGQDLAQSIIDAGLALPATDGASNELDTTLLIGQLIPVTIVRVEDDCSFNVQPTAEDTEMQSLEAVAGEGIKCSMTNVRDDVTEEQLSEFKQLPTSTNVILRVDSVLPEGLQVTLYDAEGELFPLQHCEASSVDKICPMPVLSSCQKVYIAHACEDGIYLQKTKYADLLPDLLQKLYDYNNELEPVEQEWHVGQFCCAKSVSDEQWYRARIVETGEEIKVLYIDYGNSEVVPVANLRNLDASFYTPHVLALNVAFHVTWTVPKDNLLELAGETEYNAVVLRTDDGWLAELVDSSGQSLTDKMVELGFATALDNSPFKRVVEGGRFVEGSDVPISVSFIDSPLQLWIFVGNDIEQTEALQDRLQEAAPRLPPLTEPSGIFAAKYSDDLWYRAVKLEDSTVRFIDYGNSDVVNMDDLKSLSADFLEPAEGFAVKVELPVSEFKEGATERLNELLVTQEIESGEDIIAHILSVKETFIVADLLKGGKSVVDILVEENLARRVNKLFSGFVSHLNSLDDFSVQAYGCEESLDTMYNVMLTFESFDPIGEVKENDVVAALYPEDSTWYRAKVTKISEGGIEVLFIDYGNSAKATEFKMLPGDMASQAPLSTQCALMKPSGVSEWSEAANEKFAELSAEGTTQFDIKVLNEEDPASIMLSYNGKCVTEELKSLCDITESLSSVPTAEDSPIDFTGYDQHVYISHVNSPSDFYVQCDGAEVELDSIREELSDTSSFEKLEMMTNDFNGKLVGALFSDDDLWYRGRVLNITEEEAEVLFVDYGNSAVAKSFIVLPESLLNKPPMALHCTLGKEVFSEEANNYFVQLSGQGSVPFSMKVLEEGEPNIVSLIHENKIVEVGLLSLSKLSETDVQIEGITITEPCTAKSDTVDDSNLIKSVYLIQVVSPSDFFLHTSEATQLIAEISEHLTTAEDFPTVDEDKITKGMVVAAQFDEDDLWYRAKVLDHSETETKVLFVDYGNTAKVAKIKNLPDSLLSIPPLAMHCSLKKEDEGDWSPEACLMFNKLNNDDGVSFDLKILSEEELNIVELYINGKSVAKEISGSMTISPVDCQSPQEAPVVENETKENTIIDEESCLVETPVLSESNNQVEEEREVNKEEDACNDVTMIGKIGSSTTATETAVSPVDCQPPREAPVEEVETKENTIIGEESSMVETIVLPESNNQVEEEKEVNKEEVASNDETMTGKIGSSTTATETDLSVEEKQDEMAKFILESVDNQIKDMPNRELNLLLVKTITDELINNAVNEEVSSPQSSDSQLNGNIESNLEEDYETPDESFSNESKSPKEFDSPKSLVSENGANNSGKIPNEMLVDSVIKKTNAETEKTSEDEENHSPRTPRRSNVDDHIVPGCISRVTPEYS